MGAGVGEPGTVRLLSAGVMDSGWAKAAFEGQPTPTSHPSDMYLPPPGDASELFSLLEDQEAKVFFEQLLKAIWDAEETGDLRKVEKLLWRWYIEGRTVRDVEARGASDTDRVPFQSVEEIRRLLLDDSE